MSTVLQKETRVASTADHESASNVDGRTSTQSEDTQQVPSVPQLDLESLRSDDAMAAVMVAGILSIAFVTLVVLMSFVCWWTFASVGSQ